jgi:hypothetical protein
MDKILDVMEDIKQNITDNQYKTIMDSLMAINKDPIIYKNHESNKFICLLKWLDTKLQLTDSCCDSIKRNELYKFVITEYFNDVDFQNKDFVKQVVNIFFLCMKEKDTVIWIFIMLNIDDKFI